MAVAAGPLKEVPAVAAQPYRLLLAGDWRGAASAWEWLDCPNEQVQALAHADQEEALAGALRLLDGLGAAQAARRLRGEPGSGRRTTTSRSGRIPRNGEFFTGGVG